jgi:hypothetical protein
MTKAVFPLRNMEMETKYTIENLANSKATRDAYFRDYQKLINGLKKHGFISVAVQHARIKQRVAEELALIAD